VFDAAMIKRSQAMFKTLVLFGMILAPLLASASDIPFSCYVKAYGKEDRTKKADSDSYYEDDIVLSSFRSEFMRSTEYYSIFLKTTSEDLSVRIVENKTERVTKTVVPLSKGYYYTTDSKDIYMMIHCRHKDRDPQSTAKKPAKVSKGKKTKK
jgi:hypothetical protein